jgi:hypothetical protein
MKSAILSVISLLVGIAVADQPRDMRDREDGVWKVESADHKHILEQTLSEKEGQVFPHWKVVDVGSGELLWSGDPALGFVPRLGEVFFAPGGRRIAIVNRYLFFRGQPEDIAKQKVLWLFQEAVLTKDYSLFDLGVATSEVRRSVSHIHAFPDGYDFQTHSIPPDRGFGFSKTEEATKLFGGDNASVVVTFRCGLRIAIGFEKKEIKQTERLITKDEFSIFGDN